MMQSEMKLVNESNEKALDKPIMKAAKPERRRASELMPGIAKIGCRLKCEVRETCKWVDSAKMSLHRRIHLWADMKTQQTTE